MTLWLEVTQDELELPLAVAETAKELALMRKVTAESIWVHYSRWVSGKVKKGKYRKVVVEEGVDKE